MAEIGEGDGLAGYLRGGASAGWSGRSLSRTSASARRSERALSIETCGGWGWRQAPESGPPRKGGELIRPGGSSVRVRQRALGGLNHGIGFDVDHTDAPDRAGTPEAGAAVNGMPDDEVPQPLRAGDVGVARAVKPHNLRSERGGDVKRPRDHAYEQVGAV